MFKPTDDFLSHACAAELAALGPKPGVEAACAALDRVFALAEQSWQVRRTCLDYIRSAPPAACKAGCGWCCHQQVGVTPVEAVRVACYVKDLPAVQKEQMAAAIRDGSLTTAKMNPAQRVAARMPCVFLGVDGNCRIYPVRPLRCRGLYSLDVEFCIASLEDPAGMRAKLESGLLRPVYLSLPEFIFGSALSGVLKASGRLKWAAVSLELTAAVAALLADPRLAARWLAGGRPDRSIQSRA
ncbi:MAG: YkgJ family cysteine cluster protein [Alphaproteobacteria bacterium]|nr:YkgJ family cysteine cluster protein [Alphaproteobacteria bacterium]